MGINDGKLLFNSFANRKLTILYHYSKLNSVMYKKLLALLLFATWSMAGNAQVKHVPLLMEFTQASCGPCALQNPALNDLILNNGDDIVSIKVQTSWPGFDPMYDADPSESDYWVRYYGVDGVPKMHLDGTFWPTGPRAYEGAPFNLNQGTIDQFTSKMSPISVQVSHDIDQDFSSVDVSVVVKNETNKSFSGSNMYLYVAIIEKEIRWPYAPGSNGETEFYSVMRKMIPGTGGTKLSTLSAGKEKVYNLSMDLPEYIYDVGQVAIVAWVQNRSSKEIIQAGESAPIDPSKYGFAEMSVEADKIETSGYCDHTFNPRMTVSNNGAEALTGFIVGYSIDRGQNFTTKTVEDTLAPGESMEVEFDMANLPAGHVSVIYAGNLGPANSGRREENILNNAFVTPEIVLYEENSFAEEAEFGFEGLQFLEIPEHIITEAFDPRLIASVQAENLGVTQKVGGYGKSDRTLIYFYRILRAGFGAIMTIQKLDLTRAVHAELTFDWAMGSVRNNTNVLQLMGSTDCGDTWKRIWRATGDDLKTVDADPNGFYAPSQDDWTTFEINLDDFVGEEEVLLRFVMISGGDGISNGYMDNVKVTRTQTLATYNQLKEETIKGVHLTPNPVVDYLNIDFVLSQVSDVSVKVYNTAGKQVGHTLHQQGMSPGEHTLVWKRNGVSAGTYSVRIISNNNVQTKQIVILD